MSDVSSEKASGQGSLSSIVYKPMGESPVGDQYLRVPLQKTKLVVGHGIEGDAKGSSGNRQLNLMTAETVTDLSGEGFQATPGKLGEQLIVSGLDVDLLSAGARLQFGKEAVIEIVEPRTGCGKFEKYQGKLRGEAAGRLGMIARVVTGGEIEIGDLVKIVQGNPAN